MIVIILYRNRTNCEIQIGLAHTVLTANEQSQFIHRLKSK